MTAVLTATRARRSDRYGISVRDELDAFLLELTPAWPETSFVALGDQWQEVDRKEASALIPEITRYSLAYNVRCKPRWIGWTSPDDFLGHFIGDCRYFSNGWRSDWRALPAFSWTGATTSTLDAGVGVVSATDLGILWVQDED